MSQGKTPWKETICRNTVHTFEIFGHYLKGIQDKNSVAFVLID